ncbi:hypothetical protein Gohar_017205 [Gossypium harknessii]|uniref:Uncharacterized protein n=1 Tax=Gossypium harknessii TaxID=34285 RepID=A0A7J9G5J5_9ROSI|nr:hypothetical protein [Gossypium harknessii]
MEGYMSELWDFTCISVTQNNLQELKEVDLVPTIEEYITLLRCPRIQADKAYSRAANVLTFLKRLMSIIGMNTRKKSRRLCLEYLRVGYLLQSTRADR